MPSRSTTPITRQKTPRDTWRSARRLGLAVTGGSDFHGCRSEHSNGFGRVQLPAEDFAALCRRLAWPASRRSPDSAGYNRPVSGVLPGARVSPFVNEWLPTVVAAMDGRPGPWRALDLAMGEGRHAIPLAEAGFVTYGVDLAVDRLLTARRALREAAVRPSCSGRPTSTPTRCRLAASTCSSAPASCCAPAGRISSAACGRAGSSCTRRSPPARIRAATVLRQAQDRPELGRGAVRPHRTTCFSRANSPGRSPTGRCFTRRKWRSRRRWHASSRGSPEPDVVADPLIDVRGVRKNYGGLRPLRLAALTVEPGARLALTGLDAPAAEILVNLLTGATLPDEGEVRLFGRATVRHLRCRRLAGDARPHRDGVAARHADRRPHRRAGHRDGVHAVARPGARRSCQQTSRASHARPGSVRRISRTRISEAPPLAKARCRLARALATSPAVLVLEHANALLTDGADGSSAATIAALAKARGMAVLALTADTAFAKAVADTVFALDAATGQLKPRGAWLSWIR